MTQGTQVPRVEPDPAKFFELLNAVDRRHRPNVRWRIPATAWDHILRSPSYRDITVATPSPGTDYWLIGQPVDVVPDDQAEWPELTIANDRLRVNGSKP